jgi:hypothetical protein
VPRSTEGSVDLALAGPAGASAPLVRGPLEVAARAAPSVDHVEQAGLDLAGNGVEATAALGVARLPLVGACKDGEEP